MRWRNKTPKHVHVAAEDHVTNLGYWKEACACGAYRCPEVTGNDWIEPSVYPSEWIKQGEQSDDRAS